MNCGSASLVHIHTSHGHRLSLTRAKKLTKNTRNGTYIADLMDAFRELGYVNVRLRREMEWDVLKQAVERGNDVVIAWWSPLDVGGTAVAPDSHFSVAKQVTDSDITIFDPSSNEEVRLPRQMFESLWYVYERYGAKGKRDDLIRSAVMARYPIGDFSKTAKQPNPTKNKPKRNL